MGNHFKIMMQMQKKKKVYLLKRSLKPNSVNKAQHNNGFTWSWIETVDLQIEFSWPHIMWNGFLWTAC